MLIYLFRKIKLGYNYLISQSESADEKVKSCLNNYENGLNFLKSNELHPKMQSDKAKYLIDIYYPEEDMSKWKRKCLEFDHKIKAKINWINNQINLNISKISREKQNTINSFKISISDNHSIFDKYINIKETFFCDLLSQIKEHANSLYKEVQTLINNNNINSNYTSNKVIEELINLYQGSDVNISGNSNLFKDKNKLLVANIVEETKEHVDILKNLVVKNMDTITTIFSNYHIVLVSFNEINSSFNKYENQIKELEKDIDYLNNPSIFPEAYKNSLIEVRRRLMFNKTIMSIIERMHEILNKESENRKYFISKFGKYLTNDYLPSLKRVDIKLTIDFKNNQELTRLPDLLISDDDEEYKKFNCLLSRLDVKIGQNISGNAISSINANSNPRLIIENVDTSNLNNKQVISNSSNVLNVNDLEVNKLDTNIVNSSNNNNINQANYLINNLEVSSSNNSNNHNPQSSIIKELSETGIESLEGYFRIIRIRNKELEQKLNFKDTEYKKIENNLIEKELKLNKVIEETDKLSDTFTSIENNYLKQMSIKDQRIEEKTKEINNLLNKIFEKQSLNSKGEISGDCNIINYNKKCEMCIYNLKNNVNSSNNSNSVQDSWPSYVYSLNNQLLNANNQISSLDNLNRELAADISFIKLTFFNNLNRITSIKNTDIAKLKEINESKITENEECFKIAKLKVEEEAKLKVSFIENNLNEIKKELNKFKKELEVKNHINNKLQQEVTENKEKIKTNNEYYNNIISNLKIELDKKNKEISNLKEEKYSEINKIKTEFNNQLNEKQDEIIKLNRLFNKTTADLKSEVLEYSALCEKQDNLLKEKILDLEKKEYELNNLEEVFKKFKNQKESELQSLQLLFNNLEKENKDYKMQLEESRNKLNNSFDKTISKDTNNKNNNEINLDYNFNYNNDLLATKDNINSTTNNYSNNDLYLNTVKISNNNTNDNSNSNNKINNYNVYNCTRKNFNEESEITKVSQENFYYDYSTTKIASLENNGLTQYNTTKLFSDVEELVNIKKLEKGIRCLFVPFSEGLYVPIMLNKIDYNSEEGKVYKCQYILSISNFDSNLKELIL